MAHRIRCPRDSIQLAPEAYFEDISLKLKRRLDFFGETLAVACLRAKPSRCPDVRGGHLTAMALIAYPRARAASRSSGQLDLEPIRLSYLNEKRAL